MIEAEKEFEVGPLLDKTDAALRIEDEESRNKIKNRIVVLEARRDTHAGIEWEEAFFFGLEGAIQVLKGLLEPEGK